MYQPKNQIPAFHNTSQVQIPDTSALQILLFGLKPSSIPSHTYFCSHLACTHHNNSGPSYHPTAVPNPPSNSL